MNNDKDKCRGIAEIISAGVLMGFITCIPGIFLGSSTNLGHGETENKKEKIIKEIEGKVEEENTIEQEIESTLAKSGINVSIEDNLDNIISNIKENYIPKAYSDSYNKMYMAKDINVISLYDPNEDRTKYYFCTIDLNSIYTTNMSIEEFKKIYPAIILKDEKNWKCTFYNAVYPSIFEDETNYNIQNVVFNNGESNKGYFAITYINTHDGLSYMVNHSYNTTNGIKYSDYYMTIQTSNEDFYTINDFDKNINLYNICSLADFIGYKEDDAFCLEQLEMMHDELNNSSTRTL